MSSPPRYTATQYGAADDDGSSASAPLLGASAQSKPAQAQFDAASAIPFALQAQAASSSAARNAWMDTPDDDIPDDFKVGVVVMDCDEAIRRAFIRKVYAILLAQLALTAAVSVSLSFDGPRTFVQNNPWVIFTSLIGSFVSLFGVYWKRHSYPANMFVLAAFTFFESIMIGTVTSYYDSKIVIQALVITTGVFVGLTLFTFQTKVSGVSAVHDARAHTHSSTSRPSVPSSSPASGVSSPLALLASSSPTTRRSTSSSRSPASSSSPVSSCTTPSRS